MIQLVICQLLYGFVLFSRLQLLDEFCALLQDQGFCSFGPSHSSAGVVHLQLALPFLEENESVGFSRGPLVVDVWLVRSGCILFFASWQFFTVIFV